MAHPAPNTFAGATIDRAGPQRRDARWVAQQLADPATRTLVAARRGVYLEGADASVTPGEAAAERRDPRFWEARAGEALRPAWVPQSALAGLGELPKPVLLGVTPDGSARFGVDVEGGPEPERVVTALREAGLDAGLAGVRDAAGRLEDSDAGLIAYATGMLNWHRRHPFCPACGAPSVSTDAGHGRRCTQCKASQHPRTDPVVIMLVVDVERDHVLLGRQATWPQRRYSCLAGFLEPGERLEAAVAREVGEEAGVVIGEPRYVSSQPWPFPASLMLGFIAPYVSGEARAVDGELEDVRWLTREELAAAARDTGCVDLPPRTAIARRLIEGWLAGETPEIMSGGPPADG